MTTAPGLVAHQFDTAEQQAHAATLGLWVFLITEVMLFGGLFTAYTYLRAAYPGGFLRASQHSELWIGATNTVVLIVSSLTVALAVRAAQVERRRTLLGLLGATIALGLVFLGLKAMEYVHHWQDAVVPGLRFDADKAQEPGTQLFFWLYFVITGLHALHMVVGVGIMMVLAGLAARGRFSRLYHTPMEMGGSTGTSSTSCGCFCSRCSTSWGVTRVREPPATAHVVSPRLYVAVFVALLLLTGLTVAVAFVDLGPWNPAVALAIAGLKAGLITLYFMHARWSSRLVWVVIVGGVLWLVILVAGTLDDLLTRA